MVNGICFLVSKLVYYLCIQGYSLESNRICGIELIFPGESSIIFLSVYLPAVTQSYEMLSREIEYRFDIYNAHSNNANVFILGDFNSGPQKLT